MGKNLFIDLEWFKSQEIYLIGYAYNLSSVNQLYGFTLNKNSFERILKDVDNIYCFGPDIGVLERYYNIDLKTYFYCFNLHSIIKKINPGLASYKLNDLEKMIGINRDTIEYKADIWQAHYDWYIPVKNQKVLEYNREDVLNLIRVKNYFFSLHGITKKDIVKYRM